MADLVVGEKNNVGVRLRDVGRVFRTHKEREIITRVNGRESAEIDIFKEGDANIVAVAQKVRNRTFGLAQQRQYLADFQAGMIETKVDTVGKTEDEIRAERTRKAMEKRQMADFLANNLPEGMRIEILSDQSGFIESAIDEVKQAAVIGGVLAVLILYIFLRNIGHTLIVGISIPISVVATFAPMNLFEVSLNIMSLGGLALGIGMLVDNSIVVLESIFRCRQEGDDLVSAAIRGTKEVGGPSSQPPLRQWRFLSDRFCRRCRRTGVRGYGPRGGLLPPGITCSGALPSADAGVPSDLNARGAAHGVA